MDSMDSMDAMESTDSTSQTIIPVRTRRGLQLAMWLVYIACVIFVAPCSLGVRGVGASCVLSPLFLPRYPATTRNCFMILNCREFDPGSYFLVSDFRVSCNWADERYMRFYPWACCFGATRKANSDLCVRASRHTWSPSDQKKVPAC